MNDALFNKKTGEWVERPPASDLIDGFEFTNLRVMRNTPGDVKLTKDLRHSIAAAEAARILNLLTDGVPAYVFDAVRVGLKLYLQPGAFATGITREDILEELRNPTFSKNLLDE